MGAKVYLLSTSASNNYCDKDQKKWYVRGLTDALSLQEVRNTLAFKYSL